MVRDLGPIEKRDGPKEFGVFLGDSTRRAASEHQLWQELHKPDTFVHTYGELQKGR